MHSFDCFFTQWMQVGDPTVPLVLLPGLRALLLGAGAGEHAGQHRRAPRGGRDGHRPPHRPRAVPPHLPADDLPRSRPLSGFYWLAQGKKGFAVCPVKCSVLDFTG